MFQWRLKMSDRSIPKLKTRSYGTSKWRGCPAPRNKGQSCHKVNSPMSSHPHLAKAREQAFNDYFEMRSNGSREDNPKRPFPKDGRFIWTEPKEEYSTITYIQGPEDAKWMAAKDRNYLARIELEQLESIATMLDGQKEEQQAQQQPSAPVEQQYRRTAPTP